MTRKRIAAGFAECLVENPLYVQMIPNPSNRIEIVELFFHTYIDIFGKYGDVLATSDDFSAIAYVYYHNRVVKSYMRKKDICLGAVKCLGLLKFMTIKEIYRMTKILNNLSSKWISEYIDGDYIQLDFIVVKEAARGAGKARQIISYIIEEAALTGVPIALKTYNLEQVALYEHFGFEVVKTIEYQNITQYCMIKNPT